ncbi:MAG: 4Fe-4S dicluster domain-containing protein, partial [Bacteroidetes bacterium]|nr:4Fe-4S dicluster domain-containing protein [Bacteroidota bacterium]
GCSVACPTEATMFGDHAGLLAEAYRRIRENPDTYVQRVYGHKEVGGTSVFFLSSVPFEKLNFHTKLDTEPLPRLTWQVLEKIPDVVATAGVALGAVYWITSRREDVRKYVKGQKNNKSQKNA